MLIFAVEQVTVQIEREVYVGHYYVHSREDKFHEDRTGRRVSDLKHAVPIDSVLVSCSGFCQSTSIDLIENRAANLLCAAEANFLLEYSL